MKVLISYSHEDTTYKDELVRELGHLNRLGGVELWHDGLLDPGDDWQKEIDRRLAEADAAVLLISNSFLGSKFCQEQELARLISRHKRGDLLLYPIVVHPSDWQLHPWLSKLHVLPLDRKGRVRPLSKMELPERKEVYSKMGLQDHLARRVSDSTGQQSTLDTAEEREKLARRLASDYRFSQKETIKELTASYKGLYEKGLDSPAFHLVAAFESALAEQSLEIRDEDHRDLLALLRMGLPIEPVHLKDLSSLDVNSLVSVSGYPALMLGIRKTEKDHVAALEHLRTVAQRRNLSSCAVVAYALGQCHRKLGHLDEAQGVFDLALKRVSGWNQEVCSCGPDCPKDGLLVEIHRGIATIFRKKGETEKAAEHFRIAKQHLSEKVSDVIRSDFLYSYGYFVYERAVQGRKGLSPAKFRRELRAACRLFEESSRLRPQWCAPQARLQICRQLLGEIDLPAYWKARHCALFEPGEGVEARLTAVVCGFAILVDDLANSRSATRDLTDESLYEECETLVRTRLVPKGARHCHAFDIEATRDSRSLEGDRRLFLVHRLLQESAEWNYKTLDEQADHVEEFRRAHSLKKHVKPP